MWPWSKKDTLKDLFVATYNSSPSQYDAETINYKEITPTWCGEEQDPLPELKEGYCYPEHAKGLNMSLAQFCGSGPKWTITCGNCLVSFTTRLHMVDYEHVPCPYCRWINVLPLVVKRGCD